jgi:hypothetical protein
MLAFDEALSGLVPSDRVRAILRDSGIDFATMFSLDDRSDPAAQEAASRAAAEVVRLWEAVPLGQILTGLPGMADWRVTPEGLLAATFYALHRHDITVWGDLAGLSGADLRRLPGIGPRSLHAIAVMALWQLIGLAQAARHTAATRAQLASVLAGPPSVSRDRAYAVLSRYVREPRLAVVLAEMLGSLPATAGGPDGLSAAAVADAASAAAGLLVQTLTEMPLGDALPGLHALAWKKIDTQCLTPRERTALSGEGIGDYGQLARLRPSQLRATRLSLSTHSAHALLAAALREIITGAATAFPAEADGEVPTAILPSELASALDTLASWAGQYRDATRIGDILQLPGTLAPIPPGLRQAWEQAAASPLSAISAPPLLPDMAALISELLDTFDDRRRRILTQRELAAAPVTLAALASQLGVSQERIRALQGSVVYRLRQLPAAPRWAPLQWRVHELLHWQDGQPPASPAALSDAVADLTADIPDGVRDLTGRLLVWLAGLRE